MEQVEAGAAVHLPLQQLEPGDLPLGAPVAGQRNRFLSPALPSRSLLVGPTSRCGVGATVVAQRIIHIPQLGT